MEWYEKIRVMRDMEGLKQGVFADILGILQKEVSVLESGGKKFLPNKYIEFLIGRNYDLNSLFNKNIPLQKLAEDVGKVSEETAVYSTNPLEELTPREKLTFVNDLIVQYNENNYQGIEYILSKISPSHLLHYIKNNVETLKRLDGFETIINNETRFERIEAALGKLILEFGEIKDQKKEA